MIYIHLARKYRILPSQQSQSSRTTYIVTGAGIIFFFAWILFYLLNEFLYPTFTLGFFILSLLFMLDDISPFHRSLHVAVNAIVLTMLFVELNLYDHLSPLKLFIVFLLSLYCLHMFHFMNRINGMTGIYALMFFVSIVLISPANFNFVLANPLYFILVSLVVFGFYNFRKKANAFAGDIGVYGIGYLILFFLLQVVFGRYNFVDAGDSLLNADTIVFDPKYFLFLSVYFVDSFLTILYRLFLKENIFTPHSRHCYQYLAINLKKPHLLVAAWYATIQFSINVYVMYSNITLFEAVIILTGLSAIFILFKSREYLYSRISSKA